MSGNIFSIPLLCFSTAIKVRLAVLGVPLSTDLSLMVVSAVRFPLFRQGRCAPPIPSSFIEGGDLRRKRAMCRPSNGQHSIKVRSAWAKWDYAVFTERPGCISGGTVVATLHPGFLCIKDTTSRVSLFPSRPPVCSGTKGQKAKIQVSLHPEAKKAQIYDRISEDNSAMKLFTISLLLWGLTTAAPAPSAAPSSYDRRQPARKGIHRS